MDTKLNILLTSELDCNHSEACAMENLLLPFKNDIDKSNIQKYINGLYKIYHNFLYNIESTELENIREEYDLIENFTEDQYIFDHESLYDYDHGQINFFKYINDRVGKINWLETKNSPRKLSNDDIKKLERMGKKNDSDFSDENRKKRNEVPLKSYFNNLQNCEMEHILSFLEYALCIHALENDRILGLGLSILVITSCHPKDFEEFMIYKNAESRLGICLKRGIWRRKDFRPKNAFEIPDELTHIYECNQHIIELPVPDSIIEAGIRILDESDRSEFSLSELLPSTAKRLWDRIKSHTTEYDVISQRHGWESLRLPIFKQLELNSDRDIASLILAHTEWSSSHHQYYISNLISQSINIWCDSIDQLFMGRLGNIVRPNDNSNSYHGSECMVKLKFMHDEHIKIENEISILWKNRYKIDNLNILHLLKLASCITSAILSSNFSIREMSEINLPKYIFNAKPGDIINIIDKRVCKKHKSRKIALTNFSYCAIKKYKVIYEFVNRKLKIKPKKLSNIGYYNEKNEWIIIGSNNMLKELYSVKLKGNIYRQMNAGFFRKIGIGDYAVAHLGHESDTYRIDSEFCLLSPSHYQEHIEQIQTELLRLPKLPNSFKENENSVYDIDGMVNEEKYSDLIGILLQINLPNNIDINSAVTAIEGDYPIKKLGSFSYIELDNEIHWYLNDEWIVLIQAYRNSKIKVKIESVKYDTRIAKIISNQTCEYKNLKNHFKILLDECTTLHESYLKTIFSPELDTINVKETQIIKINRINGKISLDELYHLLKLENGKKNQLRVFCKYLSNRLRIDNSEDVDELLNVAQCELPILDVYVLRTLSYLIQHTRRSHGVVGNSIKRYWSFFVPKIYEYFNNFDIEDVMDDTEYHYNHFKTIFYKKNFINRDNFFDSDEVRDSDFIRIINEFFKLLDPSIKFDRSKKSRKKPIAHIISERQFQALIKSIDEQYHLDEFSKINLKGFYILLFRFGLRTSEALNVLDSNFDLDRGFIYLHSTKKNRLKSSSSNRFLYIEDFLSPNELSILENCIINNQKFTDDIDVDYARKLLKKALNNKELRLHDLRHSYANYTYLMLLGVDLIFVREYFNCVDINQYRRTFVNRHINRKDSDERTLFKDVLYCLSKNLGHKSPMTTFHSYIHCIDIAHFYHSFDNKILSKKQIAALGSISNSNTYIKRIKRNQKRGYLTGLSSNFFCTSENNKKEEISLPKINNNVLNDIKNVISSLRLDIINHKLSLSDVIKINMFGLTKNNHSDILKQLDKRETVKDLEILLSLDKEIRYRFCEEYFKRINRKGEIVDYDKIDQDPLLDVLSNYLGIYQSFKNKRLFRKGDKENCTKKVGLIVLLLTKIDKIISITPD